MIDPLIKSWFNLTVTVEPFQSRDGSGTPTYGNAVEVKTYISGRQRITRNVNGEEVASNETVYIDAQDLDSISLEDRITMPDGRQLPIQAVNTYYDEDGNVELYEVLL